MRSVVQTRISLWASYDNTAGIEIVVKSFALAQELRGEDDVVVVVFLAHALRVAYRYGALDHHNGLRIHLHHQFNDLFHMTRVEIVLYWVIVGGCGNDNEVGIFVCRFPIECSHEVQVFLCQVFLDVVILDG